MTQVAAVDSVQRWWFPPVPRARVAVLRVAVYLAVLINVTALFDDVVPHTRAPDGSYEPLAISRLLGLPAPTPSGVMLLEIGLVVGALIAATGRFPRAVGWPVAAAYLWWLVLGMSYGKVDHDHLALVTAVVVLPTVGRRRFRDPNRDPLDGWVLRCIQVSVVATYFLSVWAKVRFGGWDWATGATFLRPMINDGTSLGRRLIEHPDLLEALQWLTIGMELATPLLLVLRGRSLALAFAVLFGFHLATYLTISIEFFAVIVCWLAFAPLERLTGRLPARRPGRGSEHGRGRGRITS